MGRIATSPLRSRGSPNKGTKSKVSHKWAELLHHPCVLVLEGPQTRGQSQRCPTSGQNCYITPAFSGVPKQGDKVKGGPQVGRIAISPLATAPPRSRGSANKVTKSKLPHKWAELLHHLCVLGGPQTRGQSQRCPTSGQNCNITLAFLGVPKQGDKVKGARQVGRIAISPLRSRGSPNKGIKSKVPHKWAEFLHHPCVSGVPKQGDKVKGAPQMGRIATSPLRSWGSPNKGTKSKVAHKWAELLHHPCVLGGPQTRGQSQRCPTPAFSGVPKQGDKVKGAPQVGTIATSPLRSRGSPNKGTKPKVAGKWAELLYHPCVLRGSPNKGTKSKVPHKWAELLHHPCVLRGSPNKGTKSKVAHKWAELLHHPCVLGGPQTRGQSQRCPTSRHNCHITPAFSGVPSPLHVAGPQTRGQSQRWPANGQNCYITPAFSGVPKQGDKVKGGPQVGGIARHQGSPSKLEFHCNLLVPIISAITSCNAFR